MTTVRYEHDRDNVACDLETADRQARADEWRRLRESSGRGAERIPGGARLRLRLDAWDAAVDLAQREAGCCGFLDIALEAGDHEVRVEFTSPVTEAQAVTAHLAGLAPDCALDCC